MRRTKDAGLEALVEVVGLWTGRERPTYRQLAKLLKISHGRVSQLVDHGVAVGRLRRVPKLHKTLEVV